LKVVKTNHSFYQTFNVKPDETEGILIYDLGNRQWNIPKLRGLLEDILLGNSLSIVLALGETGPGKESVARAIHGLSLSKNRALVKVNCATLPSNLFFLNLLKAVR
jgi:sigma54-dependent transcription regulator